MKNVREKKRVVIVEDDPQEAKNLSSRIKRLCPQFLVLDVCHSVDSAYISIQNKKPEVVFLDLKLDGTRTFLDLLEMLGEVNFHLIITTGYDHYMEMILDLRWEKYLSKPYSDFELQEAINRVLVAENAPHTDLTSDYFKEWFKKGFSLDHFINIEGSDIQLNNLIRIEGNIGSVNGNYSKVYYFASDHDKEKFISSSKGVVRSLKKWSELLPQKDFLRPHKSHILNKDYLAFSKDLSRGLKLKTGETIPLPRGKRSIYKNLIKRLVKNSK